MKYTQFLDGKKGEQGESEASRKRKRLYDQIRDLESKHSHLQKDIESLFLSWEKGNLTDLNNSNSFGKSAKVKIWELEVVDSDIETVMYGVQH